MAMSLFLRNACKINGINLLKTARPTPLKTFTSSALLAPKKETQLSLVKTVQRNISLTTPMRSSDHSTVWVAEKVVSITFLGIIPAAFLFPCQAFDALLATTVIMHQHWGIEAVVVDYVRPILFGPLIPKVAVILVYIVSAATLAGFYYFIYNDVGITKAVKQLWAIRQPPPPPPPEPEPEAAPKK